MLKKSFIMVGALAISLAACANDDVKPEKKEEAPTEQVEREVEKEVKKEVKKEMETNEEKPLFTYTDNTMTMSGIQLGDSEEKVEEALGAPVKTYEGGRVDYGLKGANVMIVFGDLGVNYVQLTQTEGLEPLLTNDFIHSFKAIYEATDNVKNQLNAQDSFVLVDDSNAVLVVEKRDNQWTYMFAPDYSWMHSRSWSKETFLDENKFIKMDSETMMKKHTQS